MKAGAKQEKTPQEETKKAPFKPVFDSKGAQKYDLFYLCEMTAHISIIFAAYITL